MIVAIVPARGGSRGLLRKNLRRIGGRSLVELAVQAGLEARSVDRVIVSTDDAAIARAGRDAGAEVPFMRPAGLATDEAQMVDVLRHAITALEADGARIDMIVTLQPTSPLRTPAEIDAAIELVRAGDVDSAVSVAELGVPWSVVGYLDDRRFVREQAPDADVRRQASPPAARITGAVYVSRRELLDRGMIIGERAAALVTSGSSALDVDDASDLARARRALTRTRRSRGAP